MGTVTVIGIERHSQYYWLKKSRSASKRSETIRFALDRSSHATDINDGSYSEMGQDGIHVEKPGNAVRGNSFEFQ